MTADRDLTLALDMNDRTVALHLGLSPMPVGVRVEYVPQMTEQRHERMLDGLEWDICEFSLATYIAARANGWPLVAIAVFPRRLFATSLFFVRPDSGITSPEQLAGRRVGIRSFHTTLCVWGLGDLASVYGVRTADVEWMTERPDRFPVHRAGEWRVEEMGRGDSLDAALERKHLDAILVPRVPPAVGRGEAVPLFRRVRESLQHYVDATGVFPIMHTIVMREEVAAQHPGLAAELRTSFEAAKQVGYSFYEDPNWCRLAEQNEVLQAERAWLGEDAYPYGLAPNVDAIDRLLGYERDLGLIRDVPSAASLFLPE